MLQDKEIMLSSSSLVYAALRRRRATPKPTRALPSSEREAGSGTLGGGTCEIVSLMFVTTALTLVVIESLTTKSETGVKVAVGVQVPAPVCRVLVQLMAVDGGMVLPVSIAAAAPVEM